jgi:DNA polymerase III epsilon subunit-like protein
MKALIFDTETTGLIENRSLRLDRQPEVIEFYGCLVDLSTGEVEEELDTLVRPKTAITEKNEKNFKGKTIRSIKSITGIDNAMVAEFSEFGGVADAIFDLIERSPAVIAHNLSFDVDMLEIEADRLGRTIKWPEKICTIEQTIFLKGFRLSLGDLYEMLFDERFPGAHRAKADTQALTKICVELYKRELL